MWSARNCAHLEWPLSPVADLRRSRTPHPNAACKTKAPPHRSGERYDGAKAAQSARPPLTRATYPRQAMRVANCGRLSLSTGEKLTASRSTERRN
jgi:hypothetical protein